MRIRTLLAALLVASACAPANRLPTIRPLVPEPVLRVENDNWSDVVVFLIRPGGHRVRMGTVTAHADRTLELPRGLAAYERLRFYVDPIGTDRGYTTDEVSARPGDRVMLRIREPLIYSFITVEAA